MTVIVAKNGDMAADTQLTGDYTLRVQKIYRMPDGGVVGGAGNWASCYQYIRWLANGRQGDAPELDAGSTLLMIRPDGTHWMVEQGVEFPLLDTMTAIGCGSQAAVLALHRGATAAEAVQQVARIDAYCSDPVQELSIEKPAARKRAK